MRRFLSLAFVCLGVRSWQPKSRMGCRLAQAESEYARIQQLVEAGALPRQALADAADAPGRDAPILQEVLRALLYGKVSLESVTGDQAREMVAAADRRVERKARRVEAAKRKIRGRGGAADVWLPLLEDLAAGRRVREMALARAMLFEELVTMVRAEDLVEPGETEERDRSDLPHMERFDGVGSFTTAQFQAISMAYDANLGGRCPLAPKARQRCTGPGVSTIAGEWMSRCTRTRKKGSGCESISKH